MIISRAPLRISYVGGGSDFREFSAHNIGSVVGATIDKYVYVVINELSEISSENIRFTYRQTESVLSFDQLKHPVLRELGKLLEIRERLNFATFSDLPSGAGLGGSSSFTVSLIKAIYELRNTSITSEQIAEIAIKIERDILQERGGVQDQYHSATGGFRHYYFYEGRTSVSKDLGLPGFSEYIQKRQILFWSGKSRDSATQALITESKAIDRSIEIKNVSSLAQEMATRLVEAKSPSEQFEVVSDSVRLGWEMKMRFTTKHSPEVEKILQHSLSNGAKAVKLCGAGGDGFVLVLAEPECITRIRASLPGFRAIQPNLTPVGVASVAHPFKGT
jgi:D-glycero-alpha-D-manno-heptose-7-phosphate kinase